MGVEDGGDSENSDEVDEEELDDEVDEEVVVEHWLDRHRLVLNLALLLMYCFVGFCVINSIERWGPTSTFYVITQIITTIGYGDLTVTKASSQWFMIVWVMVGLLVIAHIVNDAFERIMSMAMEAMRARLRKLEAAISSKIEDEQAAKKKLGHLNGLMVSIFIYNGLVLAGALFYCTYESCSCSYGLTAVEGCVEERCTETGGKTKNFREALYMAVITLSTTGFGDFAPVSYGGRVFGIFWMLLGVGSWVSVITNLSLWWHDMKKVQRHKHLKCKIGEFDVIDEDKNGVLSRAEFRIYFLLKEGIVKKQDIEHIDAFFNAIDKDSNGVITMAEMNEAMSAGGRLSYDPM